MSSEKRNYPIAPKVGALLHYLPRARIESIYRDAPGDELGSGKFESPESSAALVANAFGFFLDQPGLLPDLPGIEGFGWPASNLILEGQLRFPWSGGRHPCLDVVIRTQGALIGVESKRYEPYRPKQERKQSAAYRRAVWGDQMRGYSEALKLAGSRSGAFECLDASQLAKHAFAIRTQIHRPEDRGRTGILYYLYADPDVWPDGTSVSDEKREQHRIDIQRFSELVRGCEVRFIAATYPSVLDSWRRSEVEGLAMHAKLLAEWMGGGR
jgi:hypothetical protein